MLEKHSVFMKVYARGMVLSPQRYFVGCYINVQLRLRELLNRSWGAGELNLKLDDVCKNG